MLPNRHLIDYNELGKYISTCSTNLNPKLTVYLYPYHSETQTVQHGTSYAKVMGSIPRECKSWSNVYFEYNV